MPSAQPPRPSKMAAALELAAQGFDVFPIIPNDKRPLIAGWQRLATQDPERIREWWASEPEANIGVTTERMLVVDIDPRKGGKETMAEMQMLGTDFPSTVASLTAGGGVHLLFALPDNLTLSGGNNLFGQGVDVKSHGGYIVAPGSTINDTRYAWVPGHSPADRHVTNVPMWMVDKCQRPTARATSAGTAIVEEDEAAKARAEHWLAQHAPEAVEGERDNKAFTVAAKLYDFGVSADTCREYLCEWNETMCHPPLDTDDIERLVNSAAKNRQQAIGARHPDAPGFETHEIDTSKAPKTGTIEPDLGLPAEKPRRPALYHLTYSAAADAALSNTNEPLIEDLLDRQAMSVLYGESNSGKTFVMLDIAFAVASGRPWAEDQKTRQGAVVYVAAEGGKGILKRIRALKARYPEAGDIPLYVVPCPVDLLRPDADLKPLIAEIHTIAETYGVAIELVVIDTLSRAIAGGNENDSQDMGALVRHLDLLRAHTRAHVAVVHHTGKDKAKGARGHSLLRAATDTEIEIDERRLTVTKQRDMEGGLALSFRLKPIDLGTDKEGRSLKSCTVAWVGPGDDVVLPLTSDEQNMLDVLRAGLAKRDKGDTTGCFDIKFAMVVLSKSDRFRLKFDGNASVAKSTATDWLTELTEKGAVKKAMKGQWVISENGNDGNDGSGQDKMTEMTGTLRGRHPSNPPSTTTGLKEKTRQHSEAAAEFGI